MQKKYFNMQMLISLSDDCKYPDNIGVKRRITENNVSVLALFS